jgi:hypothetical protein|tara:strand:+ start:786 stop:1151 length:366 start_codon:yes stop_codon:yes gene_type:complete
MKTLNPAKRNRTMTMNSTEREIEKMVLDLETLIDNHAVFVQGASLRTLVEDSVAEKNSRSLVSDQINRLAEIATNTVPLQQALLSVAADDDWRNLDDYTRRKVGDRIKHFGKLLSRTMARP